MTVAPTKEQEELDFPDAPDPLVVELSPGQFHACVLMGQMRQEAAITEGLGTLHRGSGERIALGHILGVIGEVVFSLASGIAWQMTIGGRDDGGDVGAYGVRAAYRSDARLGIKDKDRPDIPMVLVTPISEEERRGAYGKAINLYPIYDPYDWPLSWAVRGWCMVKEARYDRFRLINKTEGFYTHEVHQDLLRNPAELLIHELQDIWRNSGNPREPRHIALRPLCREEVLVNATPS